MDSGAVVVVFQDRVQPNRCEFKYLVSDACAVAVRGFVQRYLERDPYADPARGNSYFLSSLYLDTTDLALYLQTVRGEKNRFKLRIRIYDDNPASLATIEIKRRVTDVVLKKRALATREGVRHLLNNDTPEPSWLMGGSDDARSGEALSHFCDLRNRIGAQPSIYVSYRREAYVAPESNSTRVTFDRELMGTPYDPALGLRLPTDGTRPDVGNGDKVILELKFTDRFPEWMRELVQTFNLQRISVPKYVLCIDTMGIKPGMLASRAQDDRGIDRHGRPARPTDPTFPPRQLRSSR